MSAVPPDVPQVLAGRYAVERELGRGGMAVVYLARDLRHARDVAVKVLRVRGGPAEGAQRFLHEIQIAARLSHPNILPLHDSGDAEGLLYYVMPFVPGESLRQRLQREGALPVADALSIAAEVAGALAYANSHGVIHRDIKPENILFIAGHALVADFGIARAISAGGWDESQLGGGPVGTPLYTSPEQARGGSRVDGRSDVYSLGCVLYEMLTGEPPFRGSTPEELVVQHIEAEPLPVQAHRPAITRDLQVAVGTALAKHPADRYQTAQRFGDELSRLLGEQGRGEEPRRTRPSRQPAIVLTRLVLPLVAAGAIAYVLFQSLSGTMRRTDPALYLVAPLVHRDSAAPGMLTGAQCARLLHQALTRWDDVSLVDPIWTADRLAQLGRAPTLDDVTSLARQARAGKLVSGEVYQLLDSIRVRGVLYDAGRRPRILREWTITVAGTLAEADRKFMELADTLLLPRAHAAASAGGAMGTRVIAAWQAYDSGHVSLAEWQLPEAVRHFSAALARDPGYGFAQLWLAQALQWKGEPATTWRDRVLAGLGAVPALPARERAWALALAALAEGRYPEACDRYDRMIRQDSLDFRAWYGRAECRAKDPVVVADRASPSGWRFRASYQAAINDYQKALTLVPSSHLAFRGAALERLTHVLFTEVNEYRSGETGPNDTTGYAAFVGLDADTVAFTPFPLSHRNDPGNRMPATLIAAIRKNRGVLRQVTAAWVRSFPGSAPALEADGFALELDGEFAGATVVDSARLRYAAAARVSPGTGDRVRLAAAQARLLLKSGRHRELKALVDSLLAAGGEEPAAGSEYLAGLAALTGRASLAAKLNRRTAPGYVLSAPMARKVTLPLSLRELALGLEAFSALGGPRDTVRVLLDRFDRESRASLRAADRGDVDGLVLPRVYVLMYPAPESRPERPIPPSADYLLELQSSMWRGDTATVRARLADLAVARRVMRPADIPPEVTFAESQLELALGDTAEAEQRLDGLLEAMPTIGVDVLTQVPQAGALVRAMVLRARLAAISGDSATARRWAAPAVTLWASADKALGSDVAQMRQLLSQQ